MVRVRMLMRTSTAIVPFFRVKRGADSAIRLYICRRCGWIWSGARDDPRLWAILGRHEIDSHGSRPQGSSA